MNAPAIIGLGYSVSVIQKIGIEAVCCHERELVGMFDEAVSNMDFVTLYGPAADAKSGISLFNIDGMDCEETGKQAGKGVGIAVRGGYHCADLRIKPSAQEIQALCGSAWDLSTPEKISDGR